MTALPTDGEVLAEQSDVLFLNDPTAGFYKADQDVGFHDARTGRSLVIGDLNRDGHPDIVTAGRLHLQTWYSEGGCAPGITLALDDTETRNRRGVGAKVEVQIADRTITRWLLPSATYSSSVHELYLGLGGYPSADEITVTWPDGRVSSRSDVAAGERITISP
jgi:hypothetical protein